MSLTAGTRPITQRGLVYHLDISNPLCYHNDKCYDLINKTQGNIINNVVHRSGKRGILEFNNDNQHIEVSENFTFTDQQSIDVWIKPQSTSTTEFQRILDKSDGDSGLNGYSLIYHPLLNTIYYVINDGNSTDQISYALQETDKWVNIVIIKDQTQYKIYVNGEKVKENTGTISFAQTSTPLRIGAYSQSSDKSFKGEINNIKIYNIALSEQEISKNFKSLKKRLDIVIPATTSDSGDSSSNDTSTQKPTTDGKTPTNDSTGNNTDDSTNNTDDSTNNVVDNSKPGDDSGKSNTPSDDSGSTVDTGKSNTPSDDSGSVSDDSGSTDDSGSVSDDSGSTDDSGSVSDDSGSTVDTGKSGNSSDDSGSTVDTGKSGNSSDDSGSVSDDSTISNKPGGY